METRISVNVYLLNRLFIYFTLPDWIFVILFKEIQKKNIIFYSIFLGRYIPVIIAHKKLNFLQILIKILFVKWHRNLKRHFSSTIKVYITWVCVCARTRVFAFAHVLTTYKCRLPTMWPGFESRHIRFSVGRFLGDDKTFGRKNIPRVHSSPGYTIKLMVLFGIRWWFCQLERKCHRTRRFECADFNKGRKKTVVIHDVLVRVLSVRAYFPLLIFLEYSGT